MADERDPLGRNWKLWGGILAFILAIVVLGIVLVPKPTTTAQGIPSPPATAPSHTTPPASPATAAPSTGDCPALSTDTTFPHDSPATEWKRHPAGMLLPVSTAHGPAKQEGDFWRCFSHTPTGAVFAAITLLFDFSSAGVIDAAAASAQRDDFFAEWKESDPVNEYPLISAFRVANSSETKASIEYIAPLDTRYASIRIDVVWDAESSDWRLDLTNGEPDWSMVSDPTGYTNFK